MKKGAGWFSSVSNFRIAVGVFFWFLGWDEAIPPKRKREKKRKKKKRKEKKKTTVQGGCEQEVLPQLGLRLGDTFSLGIRAFEGSYHEPGFATSLEELRCTFRVVGSRV